MDADKIKLTPELLDLHNKLAAPTTNPVLRVVRAYNFMRNDCTMDIECAACGHIAVDKYAYNDEYYRVKVVPSRRCKQCGAGPVKS